MSRFIGTSGWQYAHWRDVLYPRDLPTSRWLEHYAEAFRTVEVNNTFYRLPEAEVFERWARRTPPGFVFALKMSRFLTHLHRLKDPEEPVERFLDRARALGGKLGPVLLQLPPQMAVAVERLDDTLAVFPPRLRVAVELRAPSWDTPAVRRVLERHDAALCLVDRRGPLEPLWRTASFGYVRFHEGARGPGYSRGELAAWAKRITSLFGDSDVYVYFNNDWGGCAVRDARTLPEELESGAAVIGP